MEKETVRTMVMLARGAVTPRNKTKLSALGKLNVVPRQTFQMKTLEKSKEAKCKLTPEKALHLLGAVGMPDAVHETIVLVCLHPRLHTIKRECRQGGNYTGCAGGNLSPVSFDELHLLLCYMLLHLVLQLRSQAVCLWGRGRVRVRLLPLLLVFPAAIPPAAAATALCRHGR